MFELWSIVHWSAKTSQEVSEHWSVKTSQEVDEH